VLRQSPSDGRSPLLRRVAYDCIMEAWTKKTSMVGQSGSFDASLKILGGVLCVSLRRASMMRG